MRWQGNRYEFIGGDIKPMHIEIKPNKDNGKGQLRRLLVKDDTFEREADKQSRLQGLDADHVLSDVTFENLVVGGKKRLSAADARIEVSRHVRDVRFK